MVSRNFNNAPIRSLKYARKMIQGGDSMKGRGHYSTTITAVDVTNGVATITSNTHGLYIGADDTYIAGFSDENLNGLKLNVTRVNANQFSFPYPSNSAGPISIGTNCTQINQCRTSDRNWAWMANFINGAPILDLFNFSLSGDKMRGIRDRYVKHVKPYLSSGDIFDFNGGINDFINTVSANVPDTMDSVINDIAWITEDVLNLNAIPIFNNLTPYDSNLGGAWNADAAGGVMGVNDEIQNLYETIYRDAFYFDLNRCVVDFANTNGNFLTALQHGDNIHLNAWAAQIAAEQYAEMIASLRYVRKPRSKGLGNRKSFSTNCKQAWTNPVNNGVTGTVAGAGNSGAFVPDNVTCTLTRTVAATNVNSRALRSDGIGYNSICTFTPDAANDAIDLVGANFVANLTVGKSYYLEMVLSITNIQDFLSKVEFGWENFDGTTYTGPQAIFASLSGKLQRDINNWTLRTPRPFKMTAGMTNLKWRAKFTSAKASVGAIVITYSQPSAIEIVE